MVETEIISPEELGRLAAEVPEPTAVGECDGVTFKTEEITLYRSPSAAASRRTAARVGGMLARTAPVMMLDRLGSKNEMLRAYHEAKEAHPECALFELRHFHGKEVTDDLDEIERSLKEGTFGTVILSDFERATDTERHKQLLVSRLTDWAKSFGLSVIVFSRDGSNKSEAGRYGRGAMGKLVGSTDRILVAVDPVRQAQEEAERRKPAPKRVTYRVIQDFWNCKQRLGKSIGQVTHPRDYEVILQGLREKEELVRGGYWLMRGVTRSAFEKIKEEFYVSNAQEINELEECVYRRGPLKTYEDELREEMENPFLDEPEADQGLAAAA